MSDKSSVKFEDKKTPDKDNSKHEDIKKSKKDSLKMESLINTVVCKESIMDSTKTYETILEPTKIQEILNKYLIEIQELIFPGKKKIDLLKDSCHESSLNKLLDNIISEFKKLKKELAEKEKAEKEKVEKEKVEKEKVEKEKVKKETINLENIITPIKKEMEENNNNVLKKMEENNNNVVKNIQENYNNVLKKIEEKYNILLNELRKENKNLNDELKRIKETIKFSKTKTRNNSSIKEENKPIGTKIYYFPKIINNNKKSVGNLLKLKQYTIKTDSFDDLTLRGKSINSKKKNLQIYNYKKVYY